eukprot:CAMPEP_0198724236 /NCGR_PEP_ID=MMETSP1475-20131203/1726_1 /TAXON_ID= ORGANISM="Unidentified sp., Strain CCMP1999" /NCGR_SAMPLE_ID=MMETSP1475 /ASSEMBLY_ACC=CAM_ASM_001111 /LENGTH=80 /DNA_ID=CAMNT_0044485709 /DNA_START=727 /DNA_END=966 /DNA_ORIENTATION=-
MQLSKSISSVPLAADIILRNSSALRVTERRLTEGERVVLEPDRLLAMDGLGMSAHWPFLLSCRKPMLGTEFELAAPLLSH